MSDAAGSIGRTAGSITTLTQPVEVLRADYTPASGMPKAPPVPVRPYDVLASLNPDQRAAAANLLALDQAPEDTDRLRDALAEVHHLRDALGTVGGNLTDGDRPAAVAAKAEAFRLESAARFPVSDDERECDECAGRRFVSGCGHPDSQSGAGGACCGICEDRPCPQCTDAHPTGVAQ